MLSTVLRLLVLASVLAAVYLLLGPRFSESVIDNQTMPTKTEYSRSNLKITPRPPTQLASGSTLPPPMTPREPYVALSPQPVIRKSFDDMHKTSSVVNRTITGVIVFHNGFAAANQDISAELILYRPKPDVIFSGKLQTDAKGKFEIFLGNEFLSTTSLSLFLGYGSEQNVFERYASAYVAQVSVEGEIDLGRFVFTPSNDE